MPTYPSVAVIVTLLGCLLAPPASFAAATPASEFSALSIDQSGLTSFLAKLPPDEVEEQVRDWAAYGLLKSLALTSQKDIPLRDPQNEAHPGEVSPGRVFALSAEEWGVLVPRDLLENKPVLGGLIDRKYAKTNTLPKKITFFTFSEGAAHSSTRVTREVSIPAQSIFTPAYGYHESTIRDLTDFTTFIGSIDDICSVRWRQEALVLGGRKYRKDSGRSLTVENVAALYRAYAPQGQSQGGYEAFVQKEYDARVRLSGRLQKGLESGEIDQAQILEDIRKKTPFGNWNSRNKYVGFSLEPETDYTGLADDLDRLTAQTFGPLPVKPVAPTDRKEALRAEFTAAADRLRTHWDMEPFLALRLRLKNMGTEVGMRFDYQLENMAALHSFQVAQYYGKLQGTSVGMILFYGDLLAKLWALDYNGIAPKGAIKGFRTPLQISVPERYRTDFQRFSYTRLWFGLQKEAFDVYGDTLLLQPIATRIYAASVDVFTPGAESPPNYQSKEFLGWVDRHFDAIAEYEPYYHKLNQLQKWSCIFTVLKEKRAHGLDFLKAVPVTQDLDFDAWRRTDPRVNGRISMAFLDRQKYGEATECLPTLRSKQFRVLNEEIFLSGGVSLASPEVVLPKLSEHDDAAAAAQQTSSSAPPKTLPPGGMGKDGNAPHAGPAGGEVSASAEPKPAEQKQLTIILTLPSAQTTSRP